MSALTAWEAYRAMQADAYYAGDDTPVCCQPYCPNEPTIHDSHGVWWCAWCYEQFQSVDGGEREYHEDKEVDLAWLRY